MKVQEIRILLFHSLQRELRSTPIDEVTINDILKNSGISRSTFYRHFIDKYDLLNQCYQDLLNQTCEKFHEGISWKESMDAMYQMIQSDIAFFQNAFSSNDVNCLRNYILRYGQNFHFSHLSRCGVDIDDWEIRTLLRGMIYGSTEIMIDWIMRGALEPVSDMTRLFKEALPPKIASYY